MFDLDPDFTVIMGKNGSGKSSLIEALHYSCYLRSFRTHHHEELIAHPQERAENGLAKNGLKDENNFFLIEVIGDEHIKISYSHELGKQVSCNNKRVASYKELLNVHRAITLSTQDIELIQGAPEKRREFMNYSLFLENPDFYTRFQAYKKCLAHRNALLQRASYEKKVTDELALWTKELFERARSLYQLRLQHIDRLSNTIEELIDDDHFFERDGTNKLKTVRLSYTARHEELCYQSQSFDHFWSMWHEKNLAQELELGRTTFGPHLDDFTLLLEGKRARTYASRGQQKLLALLLKLSQLYWVKKTNGLNKLLFLMDDFITDFDHKRVEATLALLRKSEAQIVLSTPLVVPELTAFASRTIHL